MWMHILMVKVCNNSSQYVLISWFCHSPLAMTACTLLSWPSVCARLSTTVVARSGPLYTYLYRYLTRDMDEHISTLMCAWYLVTRWRLYGTIHWLSTTHYVFGFTKMRVWRCRYSGYVSTSQRIFSLKERDYFFLHFPYSMHCALKKSKPHGPCTMLEVIVSYASRWRIGSRILTDTIES